MCYISDKSFSLNSSAIFLKMFISPTCYFTCEFFWLIDVANNKANQEVVSTKNRCEWWLQDNFKFYIIILSTKRRLILLRQI